MAVTTHDFEALLEASGLDVRGRTVIFIGAAPDRIAGAASVHVIDDLCATGDMPPELRADVGIVAGQLETMDRAEATHLLARLRDVHCGRVLLLYRGREWNRDDLRALGYLETGRPPEGGRCYVFDPEAFSEPRDWNNPGGWAHPQNFRRYRW